MCREVDVSQGSDCSLLGIWESGDLGAREGSVRLSVKTQIFGLRTITES